jgi:hypothetical protein
LLNWLLNWLERYLCLSPYGISLLIHGFKDYHMIITEKTLGKTGQKIRFIHRDNMRNPHPLRRLDKGRNSVVIPATTLPVDSDNNGAMPLGPTEGNVSGPGEVGYGDCGEAMSARADNIYTYGQGHSGFTESVFTTSSLTSQYLKVSDGDNGLDEDEVTTKIWSVGIGGNSQAIAVAYLDFDCTDVQLTQYLTDQFYGWCLGWSVPDLYVENWEPGSVWMSAEKPDDANGHFTYLSSVLTGSQSGQSVQGAYRQWTWDNWSIAGPDFIASVKPQAFVAFSPRQFNSATGLDSKGRHITTQSGVWSAIGGAPIPLKVIQAFPAIGAPPVVVTPTPTPVTPPAPIPTPTSVYLDGVPLDAIWYSKGSKAWHNSPNWNPPSTNTGPEIIIHPGNKMVVVPKGLIQE